MKEGRKRRLGRTGDFLFDGLFILVGIWIIVFIVAHVVTRVHLPEQPGPLGWRPFLLQAFLGVFRLSVLKKAETEQQLLNAFVPLNVLVLSLGMAALSAIKRLEGFLGDEASDASSDRQENALLGN